MFPFFPPTQNQGQFSGPPTQNQGQFSGPPTQNQGQFSGPSIQNQSKFSSNVGNQQLRPPIHNAAPMQNAHSQQLPQVGFHSQNVNLMALGKPPSAPMQWPCQMGGANINVPLAMQLGMQQPQQFQNFNAGLALPFAHGFNQISCVQQPVNANYQGICPQNAAQVANPIVGLQPGQLHGPNVALAMQQYLQNFLVGNQVMALNNPMVNQSVVMGSSGLSCVPLAADNVKHNNANQQQSVGTVGSCWNARPQAPIAPQNSWSSIVPNLQQVLQAQNNLLSCGLQPSQQVPLAPNNFLSSGLQLSQVQTNLPSGGLQPSQESHNEIGGNTASQVNIGSSTSPQFKANFNEYWKSSSSQGRFQNPQSSNVLHVRANSRRFTGNRDRGSYSGRQRHFQHGKFSRDTEALPKRSLSVTYTEQEIRQWREARKKNYPTRAKFEKKLNGGAGVDTESETCRQQLKEVLAKQAELGLEVAEVPPNYLSEPENRTHDIAIRDQRGRFKNKFNKRGRRRPKTERPEKRANILDPVKRSPTLLQKLLSTEIKRDKMYLLQAFRFMIMNSFFDNWPEKPLVLPQTMAGDNGNVLGSPSGEAVCVSDELKLDSAVDDINNDSVVKGEGGSHNGWSSDNLSSSCESDDEEDEDSEKLEKPEEGEITD